MIVLAVGCFWDLLGNRKTTALGWLKDFSVQDFLVFWSAGALACE
jgi:hypothetical protein